MASEQRELQPRRAAELLGQIEENVHRVIVGKNRVVRLAAAGLVAGGHVLLQDLPGTGKTMLARALATSVGGAFRRIQCTPDLLPSDITGSSIFNQKDASFEFVAGPIFANFVLADEVNRATPRTQSALLEAMGEGQVTIEGVTRTLEKPFFVIATQNPTEFHGTYPLPESQLDRFILAAEMGPPTDAEAMEVLARREHGDPIADLGSVVSLADVIELQEGCLRVVAAPAIRTYIVSLMDAIRSRPEVALPASMRSGVYLQRAAQAWALFEGRDFVLPDDVKLLVTPVLAHRLGMRGRAKAAAVLYYASTSEVAWLFLLAYWIFALVVAALIYAYWNRGISGGLTVVGTESATGSPLEELPEQLLGSGPRVPVFEGDRMSVQLRIQPRHGTRGPARILGSVGG